MGTTAPRPFVFVLMPFSDEFDDVYGLGIRPACEAAGAYCERVDEQIFEGSITQRIYNQISKADIIVADMTGKNPNVFYETGYAHALNKRVILLTQKGEDIPFDLKDYPHVIYGGRITRLRDELEKRVAWWVQHINSQLSSVDMSLELSIDHITIRDNPRIPLYYKRFGPVKGFDIENHLYQGLDLDIYNNSASTHDEFDVSLLLPKNSEICFGDEEPEEGRLVQNDMVLHVIERVPKIFPKSWYTMHIYLTDRDGIFDDPVQGTIRIATDVAVYDYPLILQPTLDTRPAYEE